MKRTLPFVIIAAVLLGGVATAMYFQRSTAEPPTPTPTPAPPTSTATATNTASTPAPLPEAGADPPHVTGGANARVKLEEFGDFQCPPCGMLHPVLKNLEAEFGPEN